MLFQPIFCGEGMFEKQISHKKGSFYFEKAECVIAMQVDKQSLQM